MARITSTNDDASGPDEGPLTPFTTPSDEVSYKPSPIANVLESHLGREYHHGAREQIKLWAARGDRAAQPHDRIAARTKHDADIVKCLANDLAAKAAKTEALYEKHHSDLVQFRRRPTDHKWSKYVRWLLLVGGDAAGLAGAAILLGESWLTAAPQAIAVGAAVVTLGAVGRDLRFLTAHRARQLQIKK
jgi:hypothetical protein